MEYKCSKCEAEDCKLWRPLCVFANDVELICFSCLEEKGHSIDLKYGDQVYNSKIETTNWGPACPDLNGDWWGYTSVPVWWVEWWKKLPDKKTDCKVCLGSKKIQEFDCIYCDGSGIRTNN